jgi:phosphoglycerol transferase
MRTLETAANRQSDQPVNGGWRAAAVPVLAAVLTAILSFAGLWLAFGDPRPWVRYPIVYTNGRDALWNLFLIKTVLDTGWAAANPFVGAPFGSTLYDFPRTEAIFLVAYRAGGFFTSNVPLLHNAFYAAGFPLCAWTALAVLRSELRVGWPLAITGALAFSWMPYHFLRNEHLHLSNYMAVPAGLWLTMRVASSRPPFFESGRLRPPPVVVAGAIALVAWTSSYYAFTTVVLVLAVAGLESIARRSRLPAASALLVAGSISVLLGLTLVPALRHRAIEGTNPIVAVRSVAESHVYSLQPIHLLLPSEAHRFPALASPARTYNGSVPDINENRWAALGLIGAIGFVLLITHVLTGSRMLPDGPGVTVLARATMVAIFLGMSGGLGALVALVVTPQFRALNRVSPFIGFCSIAAVTVLIDRALPGRGAGRRIAALGIAAAIATLALFDQVPVVKTDPAAIGSAFDSDRAFVARLERVLPPAAMIYQIPYVQFPETPQLLREPSYSPVRLYIHSRMLRWSGGGMKGRPGDYWNAEVSRLPASTALDLVRSGGFSGVVVDRQALLDRGEAFDRALEALHAGTRVDNADGTLTFYRFPRVGAGSSRVPGS